MLGLLSLDVREVFRYVVFLQRSMKGLAMASLPRFKPFPEPAIQDLFMRTVQCGQWNMARDLAGGSAPGLAGAPVLCLRGGRHRRDGAVAVDAVGG